MSTYLSGPRDGAPPAHPSDEACGVCGEFALESESTATFESDVDRQVCRVCGAHRPATAD